MISHALFRANQFLETLFGMKLSMSEGLSDSLRSSVKPSSLATA